MRKPSLEEGAQRAESSSRWASSPRCTARRAADVPANKRRSQRSVALSRGRMIMGTLGDPRRPIPKPPSLSRGRTIPLRPSSEPRCLTASLRARQPTGAELRAKPGNQAPRLHGFSRPRRRAHCARWFHCEPKCRSEAPRTQHEAQGSCPCGPPSSRVSSCARAQSQHAALGMGLRVPGSVRAPRGRPVRVAVGRREDPQQVGDHSELATTRARAVHARVLRARARARALLLACEGRGGFLRVRP